MISAVHNPQTYFEDVNDIRFEEFCLFVKKFGNVEINQKMLRDFEMLISIRGRVTFLDLAENYLDNFSLYKRTALNLETALDKLKRIMSHDKTTEKYLGNDPVSVLIKKMFMGVIERYANDCLEISSSISEFLNQCALNQIGNNGSSAKKYNGTDFKLSKNERTYPSNELNVDLKSEFNSYSQSTQKKLQSRIEDLEKVVTMMQTQNKDQILVENNTETEIKFEVKKELSNTSSDLEYDDDESFAKSDNNIFSESEAQESVMESGIEDTIDNFDENSDSDDDSLSSGIEQKVQITYRSKEEEDDHRTISNNLMNKVWNNTKCLLHIMGKMAQKGIINTEQKGRLKDLIIEQNQDLIDALNHYNKEAKPEKLYSKILETLQY